MSRLTVTETIDAPQERIFALATDLHGAVERIRGIEAIEVLTEGPFGVGTRWRETRTLFGKTATETMEVDQFDPAGSYRTVAESHGCRYESGISCEVVNGATVVTFHFTGEPTSFGARVMMILMTPMNWLMMGELRKCVADDLADLKRAAEQAG